MLDNLIFFNEKGIEIPVLKIYTLQWEIIPNRQVQSNFIRNPKGHITVDLLGYITVHIDDKGLFLLNPIELKNKYNELTGIKVNSFKDICLLNKTVTYTEISSSIGGRRKTQEVTEEIQNTVKFTFNTLDNQTTEEVPIDIFNSDISSLFTYVQNKDEDNNIIKYYTLNKLELSKDPENKTFIDYVIDNVFNGIENIYPCVKYIGSNTLDKVSTDFVSASTVVILEYDNDQYINPITDTNISVLFEFQNNSEMRFISSNTVADIIWDSQYIANKSNQTDKNTPLYFSVGFTAKVEGCYQNLMAMYIYDENTLKKYLCGLITFLTEVEGEDERYRALLGNLGIPDPEKYSNIFKSQNHDEEFVDWTLVNKKSKELMLNYENIFPYAGTYKALLNAVKFLGYYDLIFKEWYKIKDLNNRDKFITLLTYDTITGKSLKSKLKTVGVDFGEFERYKKLNRLTMVYHLDQIDEQLSLETLTLYEPNNKHRDIVFDIPQVKKIYEYRTDEILAKLYSVKLWLETHILGVNCYIADICGEGIVIDRMKTQAYVTEHYVKDFHSEAYITPKITNIEPFENSSTTVECTLNEYNSITFESYQNIPIDSFILKAQLETTGQNVFGGLEYISKPIGALLQVDELQYELHSVDCKSGSLYEFMSNTDNPIIVKDNKIELFDNTKNTAFINSDECPIIELAQANIRYTHGNWKSNIKYAINILNDSNTGNQFYTIQEYIYNENGEFVKTNTIYKSIKKIFLLPNTDNNTKFIYTSNNIWNVPMIIISNYITGIDKFNLLNTGYILEIVKGNLSFRNKQSEITNGCCSGAEILFGYDDLSFDGIEQSIDINYTYTSDRFPVYTFNTKAGSKTFNYTHAEILISKYLPIVYNSLSTNNTVRTDDNLFFTKLNEKQKRHYIKKVYYQALENCVIYDTKKHIQINRLGDYTVTVKGYDLYNHIYVNKSDKKYSVYHKPINIEFYLNSPKVINKKSFNDSTYFGTELNKSEITLLLNNLESYPKYPQSYRLYDIDPVLNSDDIIEYDNISYALDVPEEKDFITFNNFTERVNKIEKIGTNYKLSLCDGNPNKDTLTYASEIGLCIYDNTKKEILYDIFPFKVNEYINDNTLFTDINTYNANNSYISLALSDIMVGNENLNKILTLDLDNNINAYVYNCTSLLFTDITNIIPDYDNNETLIYDSVIRYKIGDIIKLSYLKKTEGDNLYNQNTTICNEATYRIKDIYEDNNLTVYVLDGLFDLYKLNNKLFNNITEHSIDTSTGELLYNSLHIAMSPAHLSAVQYTLRAANNGSELTYNYNGMTLSRTLVKYEGSPLLFNNYLDTNYSAIIEKFNPKILNDMWCYNINNYITDKDNIYKYYNIPVTIDKNRNIIIKWDSNLNVLLNDNIKTLWEYSSYLIDEIPNATLSDNYIDKHLLFKSCNDMLILTPNILGPLNIKCTLMDIYGNRIYNSQEGLLYVLNTDKIYVKRQIPELHDITVPLKSILSISVGEIDKSNILYGSSNINTENIIAADGETTTVYLNSNNTVIPKSGNTYPINIPYAIYYSDGSISYNSGAKLTLLDENNEIIKNNKIKVKFSKATQPHKYITKLFKVKLESFYNLKNDVVQSTIIDVPIKQYGYDKTSEIYNLLFLLHDVEKDGVDDLNNEILSSMIYNISYTMKRIEGDEEYIYGETLNDVNLIIKSFEYFGRTGKTTKISENTTGNRINIGIINVTLLFYVHGVTDNIECNYISPVYLE